MVDAQETNQALIDGVPERCAEERIEQARLERVLEECTLEYGKMRKNIRSWGLWLIGIGIVSLLLSSVLDPSWGVLLLFVGAGSFCFRESAIFVLYGSILAWAAISNIMAGPLWAVVAVVQAVIAFKIFRQFKQWRKVETTYRYHFAMERISTPPAPERAARVFPWLSAGLSVTSIGTLLGVIGGMALSPVIEEETTAMTGLDWAAIFAVNFGVLGLALGTASLLSRHKQKAPSIAGVVIGGIVVLMTLGAVLSGM